MSYLIFSFCILSSTQSNLTHTLCQQSFKCYKHWLFPASRVNYIISLFKVQILISKFNYFYGVTMYVRSKSVYAKS